MGKVSLAVLRRRDVREIAVCCEVASRIHDFLTIKGHKNFSNFELEQRRTFIKLFFKLVL